MAAAVVEVLCRHEEALAVATFAVLGPCEDVGHLLVLRWLSGAENEDGPGAGGLAGDVPWERRVSVLEILHGDVVTGGHLEFGVLCRVIGGALRRMAHRVGGVEAHSNGTVGVPGFERREHPHE
jgi:hypothetical protein